MKQLSITVLMLLILNSAFTSQTENSNYKIVHRFSVEGDGGWDYIAIDAPTGRLFVSHGLITQVVDSKTGQLLGTIADTKGVHGVAISQEENKVFISCGKDSSVTIVDLGTLQFIAKIKVTGANPDAILYDKYSDKVFTFNGRSSNATVIDAKTNNIVTTIPLKGKPEFSVSDGNGKLYVNIEDKNLITVIDLTTLKTTDCWSLSPGDEPSGLAIDNINHRLFSVCDNKKMIVMDAMTGKIISKLPIGERVDGCAYDPALKRAYSSNGEGTITVVQEENPNKFSVLTTITTQKGARTICVNEKTHHLFLPTAEFGDTPVASSENPHPRPSIKPGTFTLLDVAP